jgi:uncharacterized protein (DUF983 family)
MTAPNPTDAAGDLPGPPLPARALRLYGRAFRLRCPNCGAGGLRTGWMKLRRACPGCGLRTERGEEDFFLGAMMFNLVLAEGTLVVVLVATALLFRGAIPWDTLAYGGIVLMVIAPFVFYPFSHTIWLATDLLMRPATQEEMEWHRTHPHDVYRRQRDR